MLFVFFPNWDTASGSEFHPINLHLLLKLGPNIWTMQHINKARIIVSVKWSVRPQNVYRSMQWFNQQLFEKKVLSEPAFQKICSPLIIFILCETQPFALLLQVPNLTDFSTHILTYPQLFDRTGLLISNVALQMPRWVLFGIFKEESDLF